VQPVGPSTCPSSSSSASSTSENAPSSVQNSQAEVVEDSSSSAPITEPVSKQQLIQESRERVKANKQEWSRMLSQGSAKRSVLLNCLTTSIVH
jgi:predicted ATP-dependent serine protease